MKYRRVSRRTMVTLAVCAAFFVVFAILGYRLVQKEISYFHNALAIAHVAMPQTDGLGLLAQRQALRLAFQRASAERNPLYALPGENLTSLEVAIGEIENAREELAAMQEGEEEARQVRDLLYPTDFLRALVSSEKARMRFVASGNSEDYQEYESSLLFTVRTHSEAIASMRKGFEAALPDDSVTYAMADSLVNRASLIRALDTMGTRAERTLQELTNRRACAQGLLLRCSLTYVQIPPLSVPEKTPISQDDFNRAKDIRTFMTRAFVSGNIEREPILALSRTRCAADMPGPPLFVVYTDRMANRSIPALLSLGDIRFVETSIDKPFLDYFARNGVAYLWYSPLAYYKCFSAHADLSRAFIVRDTIRISKETPLSRYAKEDRVELERMEARLSSGGYIDEADALSYLATAEKSALAGTVPAEIRAHFLEVRLSASFGSSRLADTVIRIATNERTNVRHAKSGIALNLTPARLFLSESAFTTLLLAHNTSAGALHSFFPPNTLPREETPYRYYGNMAWQREKLLSDTLFFVHLYQNIEL